MAKQWRATKAQDAKAEAFPWSTSTLTLSTAVAVSLFALLVRTLVALGPYSGAATPPMYGDYEAQRHWMEITLHTPAREWYRNTSANVLGYWGLDYPPLTAYQSLAHALVLNASLPSSLALSSSRGFESYHSKLLMRWTVLSSDLLVFFPAALYFVLVYNRRGIGENRESSSQPWLLAMILINPGLILIDHGHFQYNCISLGLTLGAIAAILSKHELIGSVLFSLAINHKQMSMYFAPAFFSHLLGKCLRRQNPILEVMKLAFVVLGTFALVWWPYLYSLEAVMEVLSRLAPFERGIYEDYVANFWCSTSVLIKWKRLFNMESLKLFSFISTASAFLPSFIHQVKAPSDHGFIYALLNCSFAFYLFSYQVHEKSILLPLLPASLLAQEEPLLFGWLAFHALLSMYPLLRRDGLILQYTALLGLFGLIFFSPDQNHGKRINKFSIQKKALMTLLLLCSFVLHFLCIMLQPPEKFPFLFEALIMSFCFFQFLILTMYSNSKQWMLLNCSAQAVAVKKNL